MHRARAAFRAKTRTGVVGEHVPHHLSADAVEMRTILPRCALAPTQPDENLIHERGRLQCVPVVLTAQLPRRDPAQLRVHQRRELLQSGAVAAGPVGEKPRDLRLRGGRGHEGLRAMVAG